MRYSRAVFLHKSEAFEKVTWGLAKKISDFESWSHYFKVFAANFLLSVGSACA
jgi:hypothetical protein